MISGRLLLILLCVMFSGIPVSTPTAELPKARRVDGYRGIWFDLGQANDYGSKYSGGLGTYTAKHRPLALYAPKANKTFFVYGGTPAADQRSLLAMVSYYDHETHQVPKPVVVHDKTPVNDPHDNPSLSLDAEGRLWVFVSGRGRARPGFIYRSTEPYSIDGFERIAEEEFTYPQPWYVDGKGFLFMFTKYTAGRELYWKTSDASGTNWTEDKKLAGMGGHYQMSQEHKGTIATAFNMHPGSVDERTNLYYLETRDFGASWETVDGRVVETPVSDPASPALVRDYLAENLLVYVKDINFDAQDRPVLLYLTSLNHQAGPRGDPRTWTVAHWEDGAWQFHEITTSTHNYDMGSLYIQEGGLWRVIAPTEPGPHRWGAGGEVAIWRSEDEGRTWTQEHSVTQNSPRNHGYVRRPENAHPEFYAFWADGHPDTLTPSHLFFTDKTGSRVWQLPYEMTGDFATPQEVNRDDPKASSPR